MPTPGMGLPKRGEIWQYKRDKNIVVEIVSRTSNNWLSLCHVRDINTGREWKLGTQHFAKIAHQWEYIQARRS